MLHRSIVRLLAQSPLSLADMQVATAVSLPTLRKAVQDLIDSRWIRVVGQAEANGGRPAMLFGLDSGHYIVLGVHLQLPGVRLITSDLTGQVLDETEIFSKEVPSPGDTINAIMEYVAATRARYRERHLLGIGIATPGFIEPNTGDILTIGRVAGWQNFPVCHRLKAATGVPVYIANDVDCMAFAEFHYTNETNGRNLAYVGFDEGVKVSLFLSGRLYKSSLGNAGLIASPLLHVNGIPDQQAVKDLLTIVGVSSRFEQQVAALSEVEQQPYVPLLAANARRRFSLILKGAVDGLPVCRALAHQVIQALAVAVANVIYVVQPDFVVIGGVLSPMPTELFTDLRVAIAAHLPSLIGNHVIIQSASFASLNSAAVGATQHFLQSYLSSITLDALQPLEDEN
ncbi:MAG: ROK family protein [Anaerolineaceae bacterium]|nr:ROK family protein [Anaerolineaceae bacterium]